MSRSRLGKLEIKIPAGTEVKLDKNTLKVKGPKGELDLNILKEVNVDISTDEVKVTVDNYKDKKQNALWGLYRALINNMIIGVNDGFEKKLEIVGVGYRMNLAGNNVVFNLGYSHPIEFPLPGGISATIEGNVITVSGIDKQLVGEVAAQMRALRKPEPYKGKGVKYVDEVIRRKAGKTAAKG